MPVRGRSTLEPIEVRSGDHLGEDDIPRYEGIYGRSGPDAAPG